MSENALAYAVAVKVLGNPLVEWERFEGHPLQGLKLISWGSGRSGNVLAQPGITFEELKALIARAAGVPVHSVALVTVPRVASSHVVPAQMEVARG